MTLWMKSWALLLALLWLPVTLHCRLEVADLVADTCCQSQHEQHETDAPQQHHSDNTCQVESNQFAPQKEDLSVAATVVLMVTLLETVPVDSASAVSQIHAEDVAARALRPSWQLDLQASLPVRAPSFLS